MEVDKPLAEEILQKGMSELAFRRGDAKFREFAKCKVRELFEGKDGFTLPILPDLLGEEGTNPIELVKRLSGSFENANEIAETTKNIASQVDSIFSCSTSVMNMAYLNTGLELANLAVDAAGYAIVSEKLSVLNTEVQAVANNLTNVVTIQKNEKIAKCQMLIMRCNSIGSKIRDDDTVKLDGLEELLIDLRAFLAEMLLNLHDEALGEEIILKMLFTLMPAYTSLFNEFLRRYYFRKTAIPANYDMFLSLYSDLNNAAFMERLTDYYFLEQKMHRTDVAEILAAQRFLCLNARVQIEDQLSLLQKLESKEKILLFEDSLERYAKLKTEEMSDIIEKVF